MPSQVKNAAWGLRLRWNINLVISEMLNALKSFHEDFQQSYFINANQTQTKEGFTFALFDDLFIIIWFQAFIDEFLT